MIWSIMETEEQALGLHGNIIVSSIVSLPRS